MIDVFAINNPITTVVNIDTDVTVYTFVCTIEVLNVTNNIITVVATIIITFVLFSITESGIFTYVDDIVSRYM